MYNVKNYSNTTIKINSSMEGQTIEQKIERITNNKETIKDNAPLIFTERSEGVKAGYNIRTDRFEVAIDAMEKIEKSKKANSENKAEMRIVREDGGAESTQGTGTEI